MHQNFEYTVHVQYYVYKMESATQAVQYMGEI